MRRRSKQLAIVIAVTAILAWLYSSGFIRAIPEFFVLFLVPIVIGTLLWFIWHVFIYKYWRANRIRQIRERRDLHDATMR